MVYYCCVPGCNNTSRQERMHRFPYTDKLVYDEWITRVKNPKLKTMPPSNVYKSYRVCNVHFNDACIIDPKMYHHKSGLKERSLPSINVPGFKINCTIENSFLPLESYQKVLEDGGTSGPCTTPHTDEVPKFQYSELIPHTEGDNITELMSQSSENRTNESSVIESIQHIEIESHIALPSTPIAGMSAQKIQRKDLRRKFSILKNAEIRTKLQLSPKARGIYNVAKRIRRIAREVDVECQSLKERLHKAEAFVTSPDFLRAQLNKMTFEFVCSQIKQQPKQSRGRRFSLEEKIFGLSLMKQSPKGYKMLEKIFALPSRKTLNKFLSQISYLPGINSHIIGAIKTSTEKLSAKDKFCVVAFDEMTLEAGLTYSAKDDLIYGFSSSNSKDDIDFCDHVLVFMAKGISKKWKQPVCYYFSKGGVAAPLLKSYSVEVIGALQSTGLKVVATVCDQYSTNTKVYNDLKAETRRKYLQKNEEYRGCGFEIICLYDVPHPLKGIRNNLLENDVSFIYNGQRQIASWSHIVKFYELDIGDDDTRMCPKLTDTHIYPEKMKKMKVNVAAQVFSRTVSAVMRGIVTHGTTKLPQAAIGSVNFLLFMNKLFDSVNSMSTNPTKLNELKCSVRQDTEHIQFWTTAVKALDTIRFIKKNKKEFIPPSVKNWKETIKGFQYLWGKLQSVGFEYFPT